MKQPFKHLFFLVSALLLMLTISCKGPEGPAGPQGEGGKGYPIDGTLTYTITGITAGGLPFSDTVTLNNYVNTDLTSTMKSFPKDNFFRLLVNDSTLWPNRIKMDVHTDSVYTIKRLSGYLNYLQPFGNKWLEFRLPEASIDTSEILQFAYNPANHRATGTFAIESKYNSTGNSAQISGSFDLFITEIK